MDKIKTVKIKNPNGSVSEETYTIAVDARNVDMDNGKDLQETIGSINIDNDGNISEQLITNKNNINKKIYYCNTAEKMKSLNLKDGDCVCTLGYYNLNDGGAAKYKIINVADKDNNKFYYELSTTLAAELIVNDYIIPEQIGAYANGNYDDSTVIQSILNKNYNLFLNNKEYKITTALTIHKNISIFGNNATIKYTGTGYAINYVDPILPNNWDLFERFTIENLIFNCNNTGLGAILIDRFHYAHLNNIKVINNNGYAFKLKTLYWGTFENLHVQDCNGGGFLLCGTPINNNTSFTGTNQCTFINCSILDYNKFGGFYGVQIIDRSNQNNFNQITVQNSKTNSNVYGYGLYIKNAVNNSFYNFYAESQEIDIYLESADDGTQSQATFYNPYFGIENNITKCCLYAKDSKANIYNPFYYEVNLTDGYNKTLFISHHTSGHNSYVYVETDKPLSASSQNKMLCYYDGTTYTDYKAVAPTSGNFGMVFSKAPYNDNTLGIIFRSAINPLYVDNMKITSETTNNYLQIYRWGMFGNQNGTYGIQPTLSGNLSQIPSAPTNGLCYFETNNNKLMTYYNGHWYYTDGTQYSPTT